MGKTTRATLVFPRTGQVIKVEVPAEQYEAVVRRNQELIRHFSPKTRRASDSQTSAEIHKVISLAA